MPSARCSNRSTQRGDAMLEALIAMVLLGTIGLGLSYAAARALSGQRYINTQDMAVTQLRQALQQTGVTALCVGGVAPSTLHIAGNDLPLDFSCERGDVTISLPDGSNRVTLSGATAPVTALSLSTPSTAASRALFGGDGRIAVQP